LELPHPALLFQDPEHRLDHPFAFLIPSTAPGAAQFSSRTLQMRIAHGHPSDSARLFARFQLVRPIRVRPSLLKALEEWIRRRLRSMIWKQWKREKQRYAKLRHLGIGRDLAAQTAGSPHGPWHLANSPALPSALPIAYFDSLGLPRLFDGDA
jgi:hypothetical protein